jgi:hypothetical protein
MRGSEKGVPHSFLRAAEIRIHYSAAPQSFRIFTTTDAVPCCPAASVTVSVTVYFPAAVYACETFINPLLAAAAPSPKLQAYDAIP